MDGRERHVVGHYRLGQPFERKLADFFERCCRFHTDGDPLGDEDLPILSLGTEPGGEIAYQTRESVSSLVSIRIVKLKPREPSSVATAGLIWLIPSLA